MTFAVAGGGRLSASFIARLPRLAHELGAVAAQSYRLASRIVNSLGAGHAVRSYADLNDSRLILICAPESGLEATVASLAESLDCRGKTFLLCDFGADSARLAILRNHGAAVGSMHEIPGGGGQRFVVEGSRNAVREAKTLIRKIGGRIEEVRPGKMALYMAGLSFGGGLLTPLLEASMQCFLEAGLSRPGAARVVEGLFQSSVRAYSYAGKRSCRLELASARREIDALDAANPLLAKHYRQAMALALDLLGRAGRHARP